MKKSLAIVLMAFAPAFAHASTSYVSLGNYHFSVTGPGINYVSGQATAFTELAGTFDTDSVSFTSPSYEFDVSSTKEDSRGGSYADGDYEASEPESSIKSLVELNSGSGVARTTANYYFNYLANTVLTFSVDASFINSGNAEDSIWAVGQISLYDNLDTTPDIISAFTNKSNNFNTDKVFTITYSAPVDAQIRLFARTESRLFVIPPVVPVPEPETYAMMIAGLGVMAFQARRKKKLG